MEKSAQWRKKGWRVMKFSPSGKKMILKSGSKRDFREYLGKVDKEFKECKIYLSEDGELFFIYDNGFFESIGKVEEEHINPFIDF